MEKILQYLLESIAAAGFNNDRPKNAVLVPAAAKLENLEKFQEEPARFRGTFTTVRLEDWAKYVEEENRGDSTAIFIHPTGAQVEAVIDFGQETAPLWKEHCALLKLATTPAWKALSELDALSQRDLIEYLETWAGDGLTLYHGDTALELAAALNAIRKVDVKKGSVTTTETGDFSAKRSALESVEMLAGESLKLPDRIVYKGKIYEDTDVQEVALRIRMVEMAGAPAFKLRIVKLDVALQGAATCLENKIHARLDVSARVFVGEV